MTKTDAKITVYKSEDGDYDIYVRDDRSNDLVTLCVGADKLDLLAALFQFIQKQPAGAAVTVDAEAELYD